MAGRMLNHTKASSTKRGQKDNFANRFDALPNYKPSKKAVKAADEFLAHRDPWDEIKPSGTK